MADPPDGFTPLFRTSPFLDALGPSTIGARAGP